MAIQLPPEALINPDAPPIADMIDALENMCTDYWGAWQQLPQHVYFNDIFWLDAMHAMIPVVDRWMLKVSTHPDMPYDTIAVYHDYLPPREVALEMKRRVGDGVGDLEEAIDRGALILG
jgi:hypothetical protein